MFPESRKDKQEVVGQQRNHHSEPGPCSAYILGLLGLHSSLQFTFLILYSLCNPPPPQVGNRHFMTFPPPWGGTIPTFGGPFKEAAR